MMDIEKLVITTGVLSGVLFLAAIITGIRRFRLFRYHALSGKLCLVLVIIHSALAISVQMIDPFGLLASVTMIFTCVSGYFIKKRIRLHIILTALTLLIVSAHVVLMLYVA
jgi:hypothetical protein